MNKDNPEAKLEIKMQIENEDQLIAILENLKQVVKTLKDIEIEVEYTDGTTEKIV